MVSRSGAYLAGLPINSDGMVECHRGYVSAWECDENDHWNNQFYFRAFQLAAETLAIAGTGENPGIDSARLRHIRFRRELRNTQTLIIYSARVAEGLHKGDIVHLMYNAHTNDFCASAIDRPAYDTGKLPEIGEEFIKDALPRGISPEPHEPLDAVAMIAQNSMFCSHFGILRPGELDHNGDIPANEIIRRTTQGAPHVWDTLGLSAERLHENGLARVVVEMKMTYHGTCNPGDALQLVSGVLEVGETTLPMRHQLIRSANGDAIASIESCGLIIDKQRRTATRIPQFIIDACKRSFDA